MLKLFGIALIGGAVALAVIVTRDRGGRVIDIDAWWSLDYAKNTCEQFNKLKGADWDKIDSRNKPIASACLGGDSRNLVVDFFDHLKAHLASNSECGGVTVETSYGPSETPNPAWKPGSILIVDYLPGLPEQQWSLGLTKETFVKGEGDPEKIAASICKVIAERGARIQN